MELKEGMKVKCVHDGGFSFWTTGKVYELVNYGSKQLPCYGIKNDLGTLRSNSYLTRAIYRYMYKYKRNETAFKLVEEQEKVMEKRYELCIENLTHKILENLVDEINSRTNYQWSTGTKLNKLDVTLTSRLDEKVILYFYPTENKVTWAFKTTSREIYETKKFKYDEFEHLIKLLEEKGEDEMKDDCLELKVVKVTEGILEHIVRDVNEQTPYTWASGSKLSVSDSILKSRIGKVLYLHFYPKDKTITWGYNESGSKFFNVTRFVYAGAMQTPPVHKDFKTLIDKISEPKGIDLPEQDEIKPVEKQPVDTYKLQEKLEALLNTVEEINYHKNELESETRDLSTQLVELNDFMKEGTLNA